MTTHDPGAADGRQSEAAPPRTDTEQPIRWIQAFATLKAVTVAVLGCCVEQAGTPAGGDLPMTDLTRLPDKDFPVIHELVGFAEDVVVVGTLTEMLVGGIAALLPPKRQRKK